MPDDADGATSAVADVFGGAEEEIGRSALLIRIVFTNEEQDAVPIFFMFEIATGCWRGVGGGALRLPMEQMFVHGIVAIHRRGRVVLFALDERDEEEVARFFFDAVNALAECTWTQHVERSTNLVARVVAMHVKRRRKRQTVWERHRAQMVLRVCDDFLELV